MITRSIALCRLVRARLRGAQSAEAGDLVGYYMSNDLATTNGMLAQP